MKSSRLAGNFDIPLQRNQNNCRHLSPRISILNVRIVPLSPTINMKVSTLFEEPEVQVECRNNAPDHSFSVVFIADDNVLSWEQGSKGHASPCSHEDAVYTVQQVTLQRKFHPGSMEAGMSQTMHHSG